MVIITVKLDIFLKLTPVICKASYNLYINTQICYFYCSFRALVADNILGHRGTPTCFIIKMGLGVHVPHREVYILLFALSLIKK